MKQSIRKLWAVAMVVLGTGTAAHADQCMELWKERNGYFSDRGYCFTTELGIGYFGRSGCRASWGPLSSTEARRIDAIKVEEARLGCETQKKNWTVSALQAHDRVPTISAPPAIVVPTPPNENTQVVAGTDDDPVIAELQSLLRERGFYDGAIDGQSNPMTQRAMEQVAASEGRNLTDTTPAEILAIVRGWASPAPRASEPTPPLLAGAPSSEMAETYHLIQSAFAGTDDALSLSRPVSERTDGYYQNPVTLLTRNGTPVLSFMERRIDGRYEPIVTFACGEGDVIAMTAVLKGSTFDDATEANPDASHTVLLRSYGVDGRLELPARFIEWVGAERDARFAFEVPGLHPMFTDFEDTSNFQIDLKENGRNAQYGGGADVDGAAVHLRPLLHHCSGYAPPAPMPADTGLPRVAQGLWTPTADDIRAALQAEADKRLRVMDAMVDACDQVSQTQDPFQALACIMGTVSGINSDTVSIRIRSVTLDQCHRMVDGTAYCNYDVKSDVDGRGIGGNVLQSVNDVAAGVTQYGWASFDMVNGSWYLERIYENCDLGADAINCTYVE